MKTMLLENMPDERELCVDLVLIENISDLLKKTSF